MFIEAVLYRYRAGISLGSLAAAVPSGSDDRRRRSWRDLPERFGDWHKIYTRFSRWSKSGVWARIFQHLADEADNEYAMIDSTIVRAHQHSAGAVKKAVAGTRRSGAARAA